MILTIFSPYTCPRLPPKTVTSWLKTQTGRSSMVPKPVMTPSPYGRFFSIPNDVARCRANSSISVKESLSSSSSIRSRAVFLPFACCFSTAASEPACTASSIRRVRSSSLPAVVCLSRSRGPGDPAFAAFTLRAP